MTDSLAIPSVAGMGLDFDAGLRRADSVGSGALPLVAVQSWCPFQVECLKAVQLTLGGTKTAN